VTDSQQPAKEWSGISRRDSSSTRSGLSRAN